MSLEFDKVLPQVQTMGRFVAHRTEDISERGQIAMEMLLDNTADVNEMWRKVNLADDNDAGYRGAAPFEGPINQFYDCPVPPRRATIVAADGSQVYPDPHAAALYYLINIGALVYHHGTDELPEQLSNPDLAYSDSDLRDSFDQMIKHAAINARRTVGEIQALARICWDCRDIPAPLIGIMDGPLLWWTGKDVPQGEKLEADYHGAMVHFHDLHIAMKHDHDQRASIVGYVDRHDSRFVIRLLHLLGLPDEDVRRKTLESAGQFEGLSDDWLFRQVLEPGQRSSLMIQRSPSNRDYKQMGENYEIAFFYLNVGNNMKPRIARLEIPMWAALSQNAVDEIHSLVMTQCSLAGEYPYVLTRADELAVVRGHEKRQLAELINVELLKNRQTVEKSAKQVGKEHARRGRRRYGEPAKG